MKKTIFGLLFALIAACTFCACGNAATAEAPVEDSIEVVDSIEAAEVEVAEAVADSAEVEVAEEAEVEEAE